MWTFRVEDRRHYLGTIKVMDGPAAIFVVMDAKGRDYTYVTSCAIARRICRAANQP
jgi:hypothetical protein